jgi:hypothetical protein
VQPAASACTGLRLETLEERPTDAAAVVFRAYRHEVHLEGIREVLLQRDGARHLRVDDGDPGWEQREGTEVGRIGIGYAEPTRERGDERPARLMKARLEGDDPHVRDGRSLQRGC